MHFWAPVAQLLLWSCIEYFMHRHEIVSGWNLALVQVFGTSHVLMHLISPPEPEAYFWRNPADGRAAQHGERGHPSLVLQPTAEREAYKPLQRHPSTAQPSSKFNAQTALLQPAHGTHTHSFSHWSGPKPFRQTAGVEMLFGWCMMRMGRRHVWSRYVWVMFHHKMIIGHLEVKENIKERHEETYLC